MAGIINGFMQKSIDFDIVSDLYDYYVNTGLDIPFFMKVTEKIEGEILELMCGTGRVSLPLVRAGRELTCVDYCHDMLIRFKEKAWNENLSVEIFQQDVAMLNLNKKFKMAIIPFHSFGELADREKQNKTLEHIYEHLEDSGKLVVTLQNPKIRTKSADGFLRFIPPVKIDDGKTLIVSYINNYNQATGIVDGIQFYEIYDVNNILLEKRFLNIKFLLLQQEEFEMMAESKGFKKEAIYGDYEFSDFHDELSPYMLYILERI